MSHRFRHKIREALGIPNLQSLVVIKLVRVKNTTCCYSRVSSGIMTVNDNDILEIRLVGRIAEVSYLAVWDGGIPGHSISSTPTLFNC